MATAEANKNRLAADSDELAGFGYKQELDRSLGSFSSFAAGFSYISILTGVFELFGFGFLFAGPADGPAPVCVGQWLDRWGICSQRWCS